MRFTTEIVDTSGSQGEGLYITFPNGYSVMIYPDAIRPVGLDHHVMIVNVCLPNECVASVICNEAKTEVHNISEASQF